MRISTLSFCVALAFAGLISVHQAGADFPAPPKPESQAKIRRIGFGISEITLLPKAATRIGVQTAEISEDGSGRRVAPFSSIIYDLDGDAWVYKLTTPLSFVREQVVVDFVANDNAYLREGPPPGTRIVTVGVPELYGTEVGVNGE